jgi:hypothetical protein
MTQREGNTFLYTEIGEPIPSEDTLDGDDQPRTIGGNGPEKVFRRRFHVAVQQDFPILTQDADVHAPGMQVNTAVKLVLVGVEAPEILWRERGHITVAGVKLLQNSLNPIIITWEEGARRWRYQ